ncbi:30S ribosomal protein S4 [Spiroplasma platyhelix]|uniref:Small ribosomal subunit protein uS4 n=1 Tax=Spiroplasma platyhelix PALS-1 TaxID=1276218 RepID=A0A846UD67_9MOLU|nr:30S ribosomal protein S4 [Spiroplasma platyhelix]MBE4704088.1 30S ribosomal protein S4 [Spiroplasma platyhelix PALS-1]NKE38458.1 30S ribosomal protein S4 [Spiroplasma platyhelix PALS-1]UJB29346.1 30S ribosomal protein S4 [Spiroplasma platyhelix PALS-1]
MARYTGPMFKKSRRLSFSVLESGKEFTKGKKRTYAPGQHGAKKVKLSTYGQQLQEKQKIRFTYGLNARQLKNAFNKAKMQHGVTGTNLLTILESRLDNIVYRFGLTLTRNGARQLVNHGHVLVNGKRIDIPSYQVKINDIITIDEKSKKNVKIVEALQVNASTLPFVEFDKKTFTGKYLRAPIREELNSDLQEALVIESYGRA